MDAAGAGLAVVVHGDDVVAGEGGVELGLVDARAGLDGLDVDGLEVRAEDLPAHGDAVTARFEP